MSNKIKNKNESTSPIIKILIGSVIGAVLMILLFLGASGLILSKDLKGTPVHLLAFLCLALSGLLTGFITVKQIKISGLLYGLLSGLPLGLLLTILTISIGGTLGTNFIFGILTLLITSAIGGILSVNLKRKIKY